MAKKTKDAAGMWERIDRLRQGREWTWRELATRAGKNATQLMASKSSNSILRSDTLAQVAAALETSSDYLLSGEGREVVSPNMLTAFVAEVERSKIVEWAEAQPREARPTMVEIAQALEQVHVETSASGGYFYSDNDGNPIRDWGDLFRRLRAGAQAPARSTLEKEDAKAAKAAPWKRAPKKST